MSVSYRRGVSENAKRMRATDWKQLHTTYETALNDYMAAYAIISASLRQGIGPTALEFGREEVARLALAEARLALRTAWRGGRG